MTIRRMDHVGVVVDDLAAASAFFVELGLELEGEVDAAGSLQYVVAMGWRGPVVGVLLLALGASCSDHSPFQIQEPPEATLDLAHERERHSAYLLDQIFLVHRGNLGGIGDGVPRKPGGSARQERVAGSGS
jgi:catechol 2,3-dioxygenase-like lactoylglutathione lyase family enzyme